MLSGCITENYLTVKYYILLLEVWLLTLIVGNLAVLIVNSTNSTCSTHSKAIE